MPFPLISQDEDNNPPYSIEWIDLNHRSDPGLFYNDCKQDRKGNIWLTSQKGLHVYDGYETITYTANDPKYTMIVDSFSNSLANMCFIDSTTILSFDKVVGRLLLFDLDLRKNVKLPDLETEMSYLSIDICSSNTGEIFMVGADEDRSFIRVYMYQSNTLKEIYSWRLGTNTQDIVYDNIAIGEYYYVLSRYHLRQFDMKGKLVNEYENRNPHIILRLETDGKQLLLRVDEQEDLYYWDPTTEKLNQYFDVPSDLTRDYKLLITDDLILMANDQKLSIYDRDTKVYHDLSDQYITAQPSEAKRTDVYNIVPLRDGSYLLVTSRSLYRIRKNTHDETRYKVLIKGAKEEGKTLSMRELIKDDDGDLYALYYAGIAKKKQGNAYFEELELNNNFSSISAYSLQKWQDALIWDNAMLLPDGSIDYLYIAEKPGHAATLIQGDTMYMQVWYDRSLYRIDLPSRRLENFRFIDSTGFDHQIRSIQKIMPDQRSDDLLLLTYARGVYRIDKKAHVLKHYLLEELSIHYGKSVYDGIQLGDTLLLGTSQGIALLNTISEKVTLIPSKYKTIYNQLKNREVVSVLAINDQEYLLGTNIGLLHFDLNKLRFKELISSHHLSRLEFNRNSALRDGDTFYMGTIAGLYAFTLEDLLWEEGITDINKVDIFSLSSKSKDGSQYLSGTDINTKTVELGPHQRNMEIQFSCTNLDEDVYYSYRLANIDSTWSDYQLSNVARIYSLPYGENRFEVRASTNLDENIYAYNYIDLYQDQDWYKKWWAYLLYTLLLLGVAYFIYKYRINQLQKYDRLRTKISADLHDDVGSILTAVAMQSEILGLNAAPEKQSKFDKLSKLSRNAMSRMRDTVWAIDARKDNVLSLVYRMMDYLTDSLDSHHLQYKFDYNEKQFNQSISPDVRQAIYLIFKEAVTNALKHSNGDLLQIKLDITKSNYTLVITDNGHSTTDLSTVSGLGLSNIKMRANRINALLDIDTSEGFKISLQSR